MADLGKRSRDRACLALVFWFWSVCVYLRMWLSSFIVRALRLSIFVYFGLSSLFYRLSFSPLSFFVLRFCGGAFASFHSSTSRIRPRSRILYAPPSGYVLFSQARSWRWRFFGCVYPSRVMGKGCPPLAISPLFSACRRCISGSRNWMPIIGFCACPSFSIPSF